LRRIALRSDLLSRTQLSRTLFDIVNQDIRTRSPRSAARASVRVMARAAWKTICSFAA
jgi:hypothetical protein